MYYFRFFFFSNLNNNSKKDHIFRQKLRKFRKHYKWKQIQWNIVNDSTIQYSKIQKF